MSDNLRQRAEQGALWSSLDALGSRLIQFVVGIILARLLLPEQFGVVAMLSVFIAFAQTLASGGFFTAVIQRKEITPLQASSVFFLNLASGLAIAGLLFAAAPLIASFYDQPQLVALTRAVSALIVIDSAGWMHAALLSRNLDFRTQTTITWLSTIGSGAVGIVLALQGYGAWSLIYQQISSAGIRVVLLWILSRWRPRLEFSLTSVRGLFGFGCRMLASALLHRGFANLYDLIIGKFFSPADLGYYSRASRLQALPSTTFTSMITRVSLPLFSSLQDQPARLREIMRRALRMAMFLNAPVMIGLAAAAPNIVLILLTETWLPCVPLLQLLCIDGLLHPLHVINLNVLVARGRSDLFLRLELIKKALLVANIVLTIRHGVLVLLAGHALLGFVSYFLNNYYVARILGYGLRDQIRDIAPQLAFSLLAGLAAFALPDVLALPPLPLLIVQIATGGVVYLGLCALFRTSSFREAVRMIQPRLAKLLPQGKPV